MTIGGIFLISSSIPACVFILMYLRDYIKYSRTRTWRVGDTILLKSEKEVVSRTLAGWSRKRFFCLDINGEFTESFEWRHLDSNKSDTWRRYYLSCKLVMPDDPGFPDYLIPTDDQSASATSSLKCEPFDKPLDLLNEIETQVALSHAIKTENYELAELIKKHLTKFR